MPSFNGFYAATASTIGGNLDHQDNATPLFVGYATVTVAGNAYIANSGTTSRVYTWS